MGLKKPFYYDGPNKIHQFEEVLLADRASSIIYKGVAFTNFYHFFSLLISEHADHNQNRRPSEAWAATLNKYHLFCPASYTI